MKYIHLLFHGEDTASETLIPEPFEAQGFPGDQGFSSHASCQDCRHGARICIVARPVIFAAVWIFSWSVWIFPDGV